MANVWRRYSFQVSSSRCTSKSAWAFPKTTLPHHLIRSPHHLEPKTVCIAAANAPKRQNHTLPRSPALISKATRSHTRSPGNGKVPLTRTSGTRTNPSLRNPTKSEFLLSMYHQVALMHACSSTLCLQEMYSQLMHMPEAVHLTVKLWCFIIVLADFYHS